MRIQSSVRFMGTGAALRCGAVRRKARVEADRRQRSLLDAPVYDYFCYVTTECLTPWQAHTTYGQRATCATWLDEAKNPMGLAHIKSHDFMASSRYCAAAISSR